MLQIQRPNQKLFWVKDDRVDVTLENITSKERIIIDYINTRGKITSGYLQWSDLKRN